MLKFGLSVRFGRYALNLYVALYAHLLNGSGDKRQLAGLQHLFGGGLGGHCGAAVVDSAKNLFGPIVTGLFLLILLAAFLFFSSKRFNRWFGSIGVKKEKPVKPPKPVKPETGPDTPDLPVEPANDGQETIPDGPVDDPQPSLLADLVALGARTDEVVQKSVQLTPVTPVQFFEGPFVSAEETPDQYGIRTFFIRSRHRHDLSFFIHHNVETR